MEAALKRSGADYTEIRLEEEVRSWIRFKGEELDSIGTAGSVGGMVRAMVNGGWGVVTFNDVEDLESKVGEAVESARMVGREKSQLALVEPAVEVMSVTLEEDFRAIPLSEKKATVEVYNRAMLDYHEHIQTTNVNYADSFRRVRWATSEGTYIEEERPDLSVRLTAITRDGEMVQRASESVGGDREGFRIARGLEEKALSVAKRAVDLLAAPPVRGGTYTVVLDPRLAGVFAHEAFGHLSESDFVYENKRLKQLMALGKRFGPDVLNILDEGSLPGGRGTHTYDDEGTRTRKTYLIQEGVLVGRLHSRETAAKMGEQPTGNARALNYQFEPIVRMTNTYIDKGDKRFEDLLKDIKLGIYAVDALGGQTMMEMFTFSAAHAYMIRDGEIAELVRDVVLTGNVFDTLMHVVAIGDQVVWMKSGGGCGKGGQSPLPVGIGSPPIRIAQVVVGGRQE